MSKSAATSDSDPPSTVVRSKRARRPRTRNSDANEALALAPAPPTTEASASHAKPSESRAFPTAPLLVGVGIGAVLTLAVVARRARPARSALVGPHPTTIGGALAKTGAVLLARVIARKVLTFAAKQGARKLASAWHF